MFKRTSSRWLAIAVIAGAGTVVAPSLTSPAHAQRKPPGEETKTCQYAGKAYSEGSVRSQKFTRSDGSTYYAVYRCEKGQWKFRRFERYNPGGSQDAASGGRVER